MKKLIAIIALSISFGSCNKTTESKSTEKAADKPAATTTAPVAVAAPEASVLKTAYVDTSELMKEYKKAKDLEAKYKARAKSKGTQLETEIKSFQQEATAFQSQAQSKGQEWAQQRGQELQKKEQELAMKQQQMAQELQMSSAKEMDALVNDVKAFIKDYGKKNGYSYIYGTGDAATVLYAEDKFDITKEMIRLLNEKYASAAKK